MLASVVVADIQSDLIANHVMINYVNEDMIVPAYLKIYSNAGSFDFTLLNPFTRRTWPTKTSIVRAY